MLTRHAHNRRSRNRLLRGRSAHGGSGGGALTLRQQIGQVLGVQPQVFADARELESGTVATFGDFTTTDDPTLVASAWSGTLPGVGLSDSNKWAYHTADAANYDATTPRVWVVTVDMFAFASAGVVVGADHVTGSAVLFTGSLGGGSGMARTINDAGTTETDTGGTVAAGEQHIGVCFDGSNITLAKLTAASGYEVLVNNAPHGGAGNPATFTHLALAALHTGGQHRNGYYCLASLTRCSAGAATPANLQAVINLHNQHYPVA